MAITKIEWCDLTVNPVVGCTYGCEYCYARKMNQRFGWIEDFSEPQFFPERLKQFKTKKPKVIFINSMSDIADWKPTWFMDVMHEIQVNPQNTYLTLTKRPADISTYVYYNKPSNLWIGQTITSQLDSLVNKDVDFLSIEPLLSEIDLNLTDTKVKWVIIGAETGNRKGKIKPKRRWVDKIIKECETNYDIPIYMKESLSPTMQQFMRREFPDTIIKMNDR
jgi:protein gp37